MIVDNTGAGDAFTARFLAAWAFGQAPPQAGRTAAALAARAVAGVGAQPGPSEGRHGEEQGH
ncbi:MAG TPA: PfkB family carbohydrate kinase [Acidimicrobiia bacterium]